MVSIVDITPAGNALFQVTLEDERGTSQHEVAVPDGMVEDLLGDEAGQVTLQDVALAAIDWYLARDDRQQLAPSVSLDEWHDVGDFAEQMPPRVRRWAATPSPVYRPDPNEEGTGNADARMVEQVRRDQAAGEASSPRDRM